MDNGNGTATLSGTPAAGTGGTYPIAVTAVNGVAPAASQTFDLTVDQAPTFTSAEPPLTATAGQPYTYPFVASGTPTPTFALGTGAPSWLSVNPTTGQLSGTVPTGTTSFSYSVVASNSVGTPATAGPFVVQVSSATATASLIFSGAISYSNSGPITGGSLRVEPSTGPITSVEGVIVIPGIKGGSATVSAYIFRWGKTYVGTVSVTDRTPTCAPPPWFNPRARPDSQRAGDRHGVRVGPLPALQFALRPVSRRSLGMGLRPR